MLQGLFTKTDGHGLSEESHMRGEDIGAHHHFEKFKVLFSKGERGEARKKQTFKRRYATVEGNAPRLCG